MTHSDMDKNGIIKELVLEKLVKKKEFEEFDLTSINWENEEEVELIVPLPIVSNIFVLPILTRVSEVLTHLLNKKCGVKINFLLLKELTNNSPLIKDAIELHIKTIINREDIDILTLTEELRTAEFKSLINIILVSLADNSMKKMLLSNVEYNYIVEYIKESIQWNEDFKGKIEEIRLNGADTYLKDFLLHPPTEGDDDNSFLAQLLRMIDHFKKSGEKKIICINQDVIKFVENATSVTPFESTDNFILLPYLNPVDADVLTRMGDSIPTFITPTSKYINNSDDFDILNQLGFKKASNKNLPSNFRYCINEYYFSELLSKLNSLLFKSNLKVHLKGRKYYYTSRKASLNTINTFCEDCEDNVAEEEVNDKMNEFEIEYQNPQKEVLEIINNGFLSVQNNTMAELKYLL